MSREGDVIKTERVDHKNASSRNEENGCDDDVRENFVARLESTSHDLEQSIQTANAIASAAKKVALKDAKILDRLQEVGSDLSDAMEDTQNTIAFINEQQGEGVVDNDLVESARGVEMVASEVRYSGVMILRW